MPLRTGTLLPLLAEASAWLDGEVRNEDLFGSPLLMQFWAISCPMCKINMPRLQEFVETYDEYGLRLVSVHMPRGEADMDIEKVKAVKEELGLNGPCAIDNTHAIGDLFEVNAWPTYFLFDAHGKLRSRAAGAFGLKMAENSLKRMLDLDQETIQDREERLCASKTATSSLTLSRISCLVSLY
jgi:thiol-disulfide isomerase/thioredoxin